VNIYFDSKFKKKILKIKDKKLAQRIEKTILDVELVKKLSELPIVFKHFKKIILPVHCCTVFSNYTIHTTF